MQRKNHKFLDKVKNILKKYRRRAASATHLLHPENPALTKLKNDLIAECDLPDNLLCSILQDIPEQLVVTPYGNVFDKASITNWINTHHTCPLTRQPLQLHDLMENAKLTALATTIQQHLKELAEQINHMSMSDTAKIRDKISVFNSLVALTNQDAADVLEFIRQQSMIMTLKNNLQLDINNHHHLLYWQQQANPKLDVCVEVRDTVFATIYRIPQVIHELMLIADQSYTSKEEFKRALNAQRGRNRGVPNFFDKPFANIIATLFRPPAAAVITDANDIEQLRLG